MKKAVVTWKDGRQESYEVQALASEPQQYKLTLDEGVILLVPLLDLRHVQLDTRHAS